MPRLVRRKGESTKWYAWIPKPGGGTRRVCTDCTDRRAAEKRAAELEREAVDPAHAAANKAKTADACEKFYASRRARRRAEGTLRYYRVKLGHLVRLLPVRLVDVDASAIEHFIATRTEEGADATTVKKEIRALKSTLRHASRLGLYSRDVEATVPELEDPYEPRKRTLDPWELVALCNRLEPPRAAHVVYMAVTGARWGESVRALRGDTSLDTWQVELRGTKTKAARRTVPIPPPLRPGLAWALANAPGNRPLFWAWDNVRRDVAVACKHLGIAPVTPNDLRRSVASWLRAWGVPTDQIAKYLGHTTSRMVERVYGRLSTTELATLLEKQTPAGLLMDNNPAESRLLTPKPSTEKEGKAP